MVLLKCPATMLVTMHDVLYFFLTTVCFPGFIHVLWKGNHFLNANSFLTSSSQIFFFWFSQENGSCYYKRNLATNKGNSWKEIWRWTKKWTWSSCTKFALSASWTHGLIAQSVRASQRNSVVLGSNPAQVNFISL